MQEYVVFISPCALPMMDSRTSIVCIHDKLNPIEPPLFRVFFSATPSPRISEELEYEITKTTKAMLEEIGFKNGIAHTEFRVSKSGKIQLLEINARPGGGVIIPSAYYSTGINLFTIAVDIALNRSPQVSDVSTRKPVVFRVVYPDKEGKLAQFDILKNISGDNRIKILETYSKTGDIVAAWNIKIEPTELLVPLPKHIKNSAHVYLCLSYINFMKGKV